MNIVKRSVAVLHHKLLTNLNSQDMWRVLASLLVKLDFR